MIPSPQCLDTQVLERNLGFNILEIDVDVVERLELQSGGIVSTTHGDPFL